MPNHDEIYRKEALRYDELIAAQPSLLQAVREIREVEGLDIVDMGAGTGRLTTMLAPIAKSIIAIDASDAMLKVTRDRLHRSGRRNWGVMTGDHRKLPLEDSCADMVVSGWSICYVCASDVPEWQDNLRQVMSEINRVMRRGGTAIIFETMGTGKVSPDPPASLIPYYNALTREYGFSHRWIRTDYQFQSVEQAERLTGFFFGEELEGQVSREGITQLPECAGVWWRHYEQQG